MGLNDRNESVTSSAGAYPRRITKANWTTLTMIALFAAVFTLYYVTAPRDKVSGDSLINALTASQIATHGTVFLSDRVHITGPPGGHAGSWIMDGRQGLVSIYPPGAPVLAAPVFLVFGGSQGTSTLPLSETSQMTFEAPSLIPATVVSAASTAIAVVATFFFLGKAGATRKEAVAGALVLAFATGAWSVSSQRLWAHGPAMMWLALGLALRQSQRLGLARFTDFAAVLTRPLTVIIGAVRTLCEALRARSLALVLPDAAWLIAGIGALMIYNVTVLGTDPLMGGYSTVNTLELTSGFGWWIANVGRALIDPQRGLLTVSPFLICLLPGIRNAWKSGDVWVKDAALGALLYFLFHNKAHDFAGGDGFFGYRYPLEPLVVASPLLFLAYRHWVKGHKWRRAALALATTASVLLQVFGLFNQFG